MSTVTNRTTMTMANPRIPLRRVVDSMHQGMTTLALWISSAICRQTLVRYPEW